MKYNAWNSNNLQVTYSITSSSISSDHYCYLPPTSPSSSSQSSSCSLSTTLYSYFPLQQNQKKRRKRKKKNSRKIERDEWQQEKTEKRTQHKSSHNRSLVHCEIYKARINIVFICATPFLCSFQVKQNILTVIILPFTNWVKC